MPESESRIRDMDVPCDIDGETGHHTSKSNCERVLACDDWNCSGHDAARQLWNALIENRFLSLSMSCSCEAETLSARILLHPLSSALPAPRSQLVTGCSRVLDHRNSKYSLPIYVFQR
jgi:hypothetical protein